MELVRLICRSAVSRWLHGRGAIAVLLLAMALAAAPVHAQPEKVVLLLKWDHQFQFAGYYAAIWQGFYADAGIEVELRTRIQPDGRVLDVVEEVDQGRADFAIGATDLLLARDKGIPIVILSSIFQRSAHTLVSLDSVPLSSPADLKGRTIAYSPGAPDAVETDSVLRTSGLSDSDVIKVPFEPGLAPLVAGKYEVGAEYPSAALWRAKELGIHINLLYPSDFETPFYGDTLFTHQRLVDKDPDLCRRFRDASLRGWQYAMEHPEQIAARIAAEMPRVLPMNDFAGYTRFESDLVRSWMHFPEVQIGSTNAWRWSSIYRQLQETNLVKGNADLRGLVLDEYLAPGNARPLAWTIALFVLGGIAALGLLVLFLFTSQRYWALPLAAAVLMLMGIYVIDQAQQEARIQRARLDMSIRLGALRAQLEGEIRADMQLLKGLGAHIALKQDIDQREFELICEQLTQGDTNLRSVISAPGLVVRQVYPLRGNESVLGLDYNTDPRQSEAAQRAVERHAAVVAGPLLLVQGGRGLVIRYPVFIRETPESEEKLWGLVGISLDYDALLASTGLLGLSLSTDLAVRGRDGLGEHGEVFFGDSIVFKADPVLQEINFPSGSWQIAAVPRGGWNAQRRPDWTVWAVGLLLSSLVLLMLIFREHQLREHEDTARRLEVLEATRARAQALARVSSLRHEFATNTVIMSPEFCEMMGLEARETSISAENFLRYVDPADHRRVTKLAALSQKKQSKYALDTELIPVQGRPHRVHMQSEIMLDKYGRATGAFITVQDITERYEAQEALRQSEERFALAMLGSSDSLWDIDFVTQKVYYSPRFREMFGLGPNWRGDTMAAGAALIHRDDVDRVQSEINALMRSSNEKLETELRAVTPGGKVLDILTRAHMVRDAHGKPLRMVGTNVDVTPLKNAERETRRLHSQLQQAQKMEAIGHLAGGIAHDFNNILTSILGFNELAQNGLLSGTPEYRIERYLGEVATSAARARDLVQQLLVFSRPSGASRRNVGVVSVVRDTMKMLRAAVPSTIAIELDLVDHEIFVVANEVQLHQAVLNLVINARDAVGDQGWIKVKVSSGQMDARACGSCHQRFSGDFAVVSVSDTGCGIPPEVRTRMFEPFFTSKEQGKGTGMGLAVVHGTVHGMNGHLRVDSEVGLGTNISLFIPLSPVQAPDETEARLIPAAGAMKGSRILFAEDEDAVAEVIGEALTQAGYVVERGRNGAEALAAFDAAPASFDLVLTDQAMPLMSGATLVERILKRRPGLPIILISGYSDVVNELTAPGMGISVFLAKPVSLSVLVDAVNQLLTKPVDPVASA